MYSKEMLIGVLLGCSKMDFVLERNTNSKMGYIVRLSLSIRAEKEFLLGLKRSFLQHEISSSYKEKESKTRPRPILKIGGIKNLYKIVEMTPDLPDAKNEWAVFREVVHLVSHGEHRNAEGLERIFELKGVI